MHSVSLNRPVHRSGLAIWYNPVKMRDPRNNPEAGQQIVHENRPYRFSAYDAAWPGMFAETAAAIRAILGEEIVDVEHVGSTSIPGMSAKPQIDILVTVKHFDRVPDFYERMSREGFTPRGDYTNEGEEYFTQDEVDGTRRTSVHVLPVGHQWAFELLAFRDYLRAHPDEMDYYRSTKDEANKLFPDNYTYYYVRKDPVLKEIKARAIKWKQAQERA